MRCPYCRTRLTETSPECPSCRLTLDRASALLGPVPRMTHGVADQTGLLPRGDAGRIAKAISRLTWTFPQVNLQVLVTAFGTDHPFELHVFWLFNLGGISMEAHKGGENRNILLVLDPLQGRSGLTVGYGLEPFITDEALDHLLELSEPAWIAGDWTRGILDVIAGLDRLLEGAALGVANGFGLPALAATKKRGEF